MSVSLENFFKDRQILITGVTGFVGKVLLEKLLYSCPGIAKIYLLMRSKKDVDVKSRVEKMLKSKIFQRLTNQNCLDKLIAIEADITQPFFALDSTSVNEIKQNVSIIFHLAASIRFDESLKNAIAINLLPVKHLLQLSHQMTNLKAIVHLSTAYVNCKTSKTDEVIYPLDISPNKLIQLYDGLNDKLSEALTPFLLNGYPNTYSYTKCLAENLLFEEGKDLPIAIIRPSMITAALNEPFPGWIDNLQHVTANIVAAGTGLTRNIYFGSNSVVDLIPVDLCVNLAIAVARETTRCKEIKIYNCISSSTNPLQMLMLDNHILKKFSTNTFHKMYRLPYATAHTQYLTYSTSMLFDYLTFIYPFNAILHLLGQKPMLKKYFLKFWANTSIAKYFLAKNWYFINQNVNKLWSNLPNTDQKIFHFHVDQINWDIYLHNYVLGCKLYVMNESLCNLSSDQKLYSKFYWLHRLIRIIKCLGVIITCKKYKPLILTLCIFILFK